MHGNNHPAVDAVIFDYGAVLCHAPLDADFARCAELAGMQPNTFVANYKATRAEYDRGRRSTAEYWQSIAEGGRNFSAEQIAGLAALDMEMWGRFNDSMIALAAEVKNRGYKTGILSNAHTDCVAFLRQADWLEQFDVEVFSCEHGLVKPEPEIYQLALERLGVEASRAVFIDDFAPNVEAARNVGIRALLFTSAPRLRAELSALLGVELAGAA